MKTVTCNSNICAATDKHSSRYALANVLHSTGYLTATNGRILAAVPCSETVVGDDPADAAPLGMIPAKLCNRGVKIKKNGNAFCDARKPESGYFEPREGRFPRVNEYFPSVDPDKVTVLKIDGALLGALADAMAQKNPDGEGTSTVVTLLIRDRHAPVCVLGQHGAIGVIAPCLGDESEREIAEKFNARLRDYWASFEPSPVA